jgi:dihydroneopterin aldolase
MDIIFIHGIEFYAYHGASDEEQSVGHRYSVDVEIGYDLRNSGKSDNLDDTVNYSRVAKRVVAIGANNQYRLIESLAENISRAILKEFPVDSVKLRVKKMLPPMNVIAEAVGVEIFRRKDE